jgi:hypothetical protein
MTPRYNIYVSKRGNLFMSELAQLIASAIGDLGRNAKVLTEGLPERSSGTVNLVLAPHEFFVLQGGRSEKELLEAAAASVSISTEQPGTSWFELGQRFSAVGPFALDINQHAVTELCRRGIDARVLPLGYHPSWDSWDRDISGARPTDILFLGALTRRRELFFSRAADELWDYDCNIRLFDFRVPQTEQGVGFVGGTTKWKQLASSKILLNIHRDEVPYFEWARILEAIANGCVVISELSVGHAPLVPGQHFLQVPLERAADYAVALLADPDLRAEIATEAYDFVRTKLVLTDMLEPIVEELERGIRTGTGPARPATMRQPGRAPRRPSLPADHSGKTDTTEGETLRVQQMRTRIKELVLDEIQLLRRLEAMESRVRFGSTEEVATESTPAYEGFEPDITVVVSLYNYEKHIGQAIDSVVHSYGVVADLVVVDDHSRDQSREVARSKLAEYPWFPIRLISKMANHGLSAARNTGFEAGRAEKIFVLDADNTVYPNGLQKLSAALDGSDARFAYGIIASYGAREGLLSCLPWAVELLTIGNYIDAMAMIRRSTWEELGGYDGVMDVLGGGWEDYDFFLRLAAAGQRGVLVPEIVARYQSHPTSMLATVNVDTSALVSWLRDRYPTLPWQES